RRSVSESRPSEGMRPPIRRSSECAFFAQRRAPSRSKISTARWSDSRAARLCCALRCTVPSARSVRANSSGFTCCGGSGSWVAARSPRADLRRECARRSAGAPSAPSSPRGARRAARRSRQPVGATRVPRACAAPCAAPFRARGASGRTRADSPAAAARAPGSPLGRREPTFGGNAPADPPELRVRLLRPEARAEPLEDLDSPLERLACRALVLRLALHRSEREERPGELERIHLLRRLGLLGRR